MHLYLHLPVLSFAYYVIFPFNGAVARLRANYNPRAVQLGSDTGEVVLYSGVGVPGVVAMIKRIHHLESWPGLFKGIWPTWAAGWAAYFVFAFLGTILGFGGLHNAWGHFYTYPVWALAVALFHSVIAVITSLPMQVIIVRAMTTPHMLPWFEIQKGLNTLLTPVERHRPWVMYSTPGLFASLLLREVWLTAAVGALRVLFMGHYQRPSFFYTTPKDIAIMLPLVIISTALLCPLDTLAVRLYIQPNYEAGSLLEEDAPPDYSALGLEPVINFRAEESKEPYAGLWDAARQTVREEGVSVLYRGWWVTMLGILTVV